MYMNMFHPVYGFDETELSNGILWEYWKCILWFHIYLVCVAMAMAETTVKTT